MIFYSKKIILPIVVVIIAVSVFLLQDCTKKSHSDMGKTLFIKTKNKVFKDVTPEGFAEVFKQVLANEKTKMGYPSLITDYYDEHDYDPTFVMDHLFNGDLKASLLYYRQADQHGLNPKLFYNVKMDSLISKFYRKDGIKTLDEAYHDMAELEMLSANSLIKYSNALEYGVINPKYIYARYATETKRPDSVSMSVVFHEKSLRTYLDSIQPKDPQYVALQKALADDFVAPDQSKEQTQRAIIVNLERLRWRNKPTASKYVIVNIPDYMLNVIDSGKSVLDMKVCVGQGRNKDNTYSLASYVDSAKVDKPNPHETPQLNSMINMVDVNPIWNIPQSIVSKEIIKAALDDKFYLANKGISVYKNGHKITNTEDINWTAAGKTGSDYEFKQAPGDDNSLGKIKFLFPNESSVYLHDTPAKFAFKRADRDVSHGCVRLGNPQGLALNLFGPGAKYDLIAKDMALDKPEPTSINLPKKVPVYITYITCWADTTGTLQFRNDVYGLDVVLHAALANL